MTYRSIIAFALTAILIVVPSIVGAVGAARFVAGLESRPSFLFYIYIWYGAVGVWVVAIIVAVYFWAGWPAGIIPKDGKLAKGVLIGIVVGALALGVSCAANINTFVTAVT